MQLVACHLAPGFLFLSQGLEPLHVLHGAFHVSLELVEIELAVAILISNTEFLAAGFIG